MNCRRSCGGSVWLMSRSESRKSLLSILGFSGVRAGRPAVCRAARRSVGWYPGARCGDGQPLRGGHTVRCAPAFLITGGRYWRVFLVGLCVNPTSTPPCGFRDSRRPRACGGLEFTLWRPGIHPGCAVSGAPPGSRRVLVGTSVSRLFLIAALFPASSSTGSGGPRRVGFRQAPLALEGCDFGLGSRRLPW